SAVLRSRTQTALTKLQLRFSAGRPRLSKPARLGSSRDDRAHSNRQGNRQEGILQSTNGTRSSLRNDHVLLPVPTGDALQQVPDLSALPADRGAGRRGNEGDRRSTRKGLALLVAAP